MKSFPYIALLLVLMFGSCSNEPSLQKFFVESASKKDFVALDVSSSILNVDKAKLSAEQAAALNSFDKMNIVAFRATPQNQKEYQTEKAKIKGILKDKKYQQLMKFGSGESGASVSYLGSDDHIEEFVFYANRKENGFAVIRVTGEDMNPNNIMNLLGVLQKSNIDMDQLKPLEGLMKK